MGKAILTLTTKRYQKLPAWVMTLLACLMVLSFLFVGETAVSILFSIVGTLFFLSKWVACSLLTKWLLCLITSM